MAIVKTPNLVPLVFQQQWAQFQPGETAGVPARLVPTLIASGTARRVGDPPPPESEPVDTKKGKGGLPPPEEAVQLQLPPFRELLERVEDIDYLKRLRQAEGERKGGPRKGAVEAINGLIDEFGGKDG